MIIIDTFSPQETLHASCTQDLERHEIVFDGIDTRIPYAKDQPLHLCISSSRVRPICSVEDLLLDMGMGYTESIDVSMITTMGGHQPGHNSHFSHLTVECIRAVGIKEVQPPYGREQYTEFHHYAVLSSNIFVPIVRCNSERKEAVAETRYVRFIKKKQRRLPPDRAKGKGRISVTLDQVSCATSCSHGHFHFTVVYRNCLGNNSPLSQMALRHAPNRHFY